MSAARKSLLPHSGKSWSRQVDRRRFRRGKGNLVKGVFRQAQRPGLHGRPPDVCTHALQLLDRMNKMNGMFVSAKQAKTDSFGSFCKFCQKFSPVSMDGRHPVANAVEKGPFRQAQRPGLHLPPPAQDSPPAEYGWRRGVTEKRNPRQRMSRDFRSACAESKIPRRFLGAIPGGRGGNSCLLPLDVLLQETVALIFSACTHVEK